MHITIVINLIKFKNRKKYENLSLNNIDKYNFFNVISNQISNIQKSLNKCINYNTAIHDKSKIFILIFRVIVFGINLKKRIIELKLNHIFLSIFYLYKLNKS